MSKFKVGDIVRVKDNCPDRRTLQGRTGKVVEIMERTNMYGGKDLYVGIYFDGWRGGHNFSGRIRDLTTDCGGWFIKEDYLDALSSRLSVWPPVEKKRKKITFKDQCVK